MIKILFPILTLFWRVNNYVSRQRKVYIGEMKVQLLLYKLLPSRTVQLLTFDCLYSEDFSLLLKRGVQLLDENKIEIQSSPLIKSFPQA